MNADTLLTGEPMSLWLSLLKAAAGIVIMLLGSHWLIEGAISIGRIFNVSQLVIGLILIAIGTSLPELGVSLTASLKGHGEVVVGNIVGSNVFNLTMILGTATLIKPQRIHSKLVLAEFPLTILMGIALVGMVWVDEQSLTLSRGEGVVLVCFLLSFLYLQRFSWKASQTTIGNSGKSHSISPLRSILLFLVGLTFLIFGSDLAVSGSVEAARALGVSEYLISAILLAWSTSLPEFVTSVTAAIKGKRDIAVGNIIGSNIFNVAGIMGPCGMVNPISFRAEYLVDIGAWIIPTLVLWLAGIRRDQQLIISRVSGALLLIIFFSYMAYLIVRELQSVHA